MTPSGKKTMGLPSRLASFFSFPVLLSLSFVPGTLLPYDLDKVQFQTIQVRDGIYILRDPGERGSGGNIGFSVGSDGIFVIDDQYAGLNRKITSAISEISDQPIRFLFNTHWHHDHAGGNEPMAEKGVVIVAHDNVRLRMSAEQFISFFKINIPPYPERALPIVTFSRDITFHFNGDEIHAFHVEPAHTDSDSVVIFRKANVVHMGDLFYTGRYPFIDVPNGGSVDGVIAAANRVLERVDGEVKIIPGHGSLSNRDELREYRNMLVAVRERMLTLISAGKTLPEIISSRPTSEFDKGRESWFTPAAFLEILYDDLSRIASLKTQ